MDVFALYERMDRLEELVEDMRELGISTVEEAEKLIQDLDSQIEALETDSGNRN
jgi:polyhydroxyalkanoate synthesis regulator phasin